MCVGKYNVKFAVHSNFIHIRAFLSEVYLILSTLSLDTGNKKCSMRQTPVTGILKLKQLKWKHMG